MRLLLDTHVALWAVKGDGQLDGRTARQIADPHNEVAISIATLWEISVKNGSGERNRLSIGLTVSQAAIHFAAAQFATLAISISSLEMLETLPPIHRDPFDRLLVATAKAEQWRLVTHDQMLAGYGDFVYIV